MGVGLDTDALGAALLFVGGVAILGLLAWGLWRRNGK